MVERRESEASVACRAAAAQLGDVVGSSYSTEDGEPLAWAFHVEATDGHLVYAGAADADHDIVLRCAEDHAFTTMLHAKALFLTSTIDELVVGQPGVVMLTARPEAASWFCDSFLAKPDGPRLFATALHVAEVGLDGARALAAVAARTPTLVTSPDPLHDRDGYREAVKLVRGLRRLIRLRELNAPEIIIDNDMRMARERVWPAWLALPADVVEVAAELGLRVTPP